MDMFLQQIVNAISLGGIYALLALGLAVVFSIVSLINFAHGELMTVGGYAIFFATLFGAPFWLALLISLLVAAIFGALMEIIAFRPFRNADIVTMLLTSFAVSSILHVLFQNAIGARPKAIAVPSILSGALTLGPFNFGTISIFAIVATIVCLVLLVAFLKGTHIGITMRAAAQDFEITRLMGVNANAVLLLAFTISGVLAAVASILWIFQRGAVEPTMGTYPILKAFIVVVLGGLGSIPGAVLGGIILGTLEVFLRAYLPESILPFRDAISLSLVIGIFTFYPNGILGRAEEIR